MAPPQEGVDKGDSLSMWRVAANILNKQSQKAAGGDPPSWGLGRRLTAPHHKIQSLLQNIMYDLRLGLSLWVGCCECHDEPLGSGPTDLVISISGGGSNNKNVYVLYLICLMYLIIFFHLFLLSAMRVSMGVVNLICLERNRKKITWQQHCSVFCVVDYEKDIQSRYWQHCPVSICYLFHYYIICVVNTASLHFLHLNKQIQ
jgi:hypothetical protein